MLSRFSIGTRMLAILVATLLGMVAVGTIGLWHMRDARIEDREREIRHMVQAAAGVIAHYHREAAAGRLPEADAQTAALAALRDVRYGDNDYFFVYQYDGINRMLGPRPEFEGQNRLDLVDADGVAFVRDMITAARQGGGFVRYRFPRAGQQEPSPKLAYAAGFEPWQWLISTGVYVDDIEEAFREDVALVGGITLGLVLAIGAGVLLVSRGVTRPLAQITAAMGALAAGDTAVEVSHTGDHDEIGRLARALTTFRTNAIEMDRLRAGQEAARQRAEAERRALMLKTADGFETSVAGVVRSVSSAATEMQTSAHAMSTVSDEASRQATAVTSAAAEASASVQTVAAAAEELNSSIEEITRQITESATVAGTCAAQAEAAGSVMRELDAAAENIGTVVGLIEGIAGQVNLLALNASIEAARAGDAGRGFAVVAGEVKSLANQTASATQDIATQVSAVQERTRTAVDAIAGITGTINRVKEISTAIASAVEEQSAATREIARNVQQAAQGTGEVTDNIAGVTEAASKTGAAATQVLGAAQRLSREAETLRATVDGFIAQIRTG